MKNFTCQCCGQCCKWDGFVKATEEEMNAAAKLLGISLDEFIQKYTKLSQDRQSLIFADREDGACIFLNDNNRCKIYAARPWQCRTFPHEWDVPPEYQKLCPGHRLAEAANALEAAAALPFIHVLGHPALPLNIENAPGDAQVLNCHNFCLMLSQLGLPYIYYGCPGSKLPPGGAFVDSGKPTGKWSYRNKWHQIYNKRLTSRLKKYAHLDGTPEIIASIYGAAQSDIDPLGLPVIEAMVGYDHCWAPYRVFPSYAHQHTIYAQQPDFTAKNRFFDTVIPHFLDDTQYWPSDHPQDYLLFIGRDAPGKGLPIAQQAAEKAGLELKVVHNGCFGAAKTELLANARAVLMPTLYVEPFGYVAIEAQMCGTPIITTDWGAFAETVLHGLTGFRCRTQAEFVAAIGKIQRLDRNFIRDYALNHFSIKKIAPKYKAYFDFVWNVHKNGGYYADAAFRDESFL